MAPLQAVLFDIWNTLIADTPALTERREALRLEGVTRALAAGGQPHQREAVESAYRALLEEMAAQHTHGRDLSLEERVCLLLSKAAPENAVSPALIRDVSQAFVRPAQSVPPPLQPGALEAVRNLREAGLRIGLISNTGPSPGRALRHVLQWHGLLPHFDALTFSDEVGVCKPASEVFQRTLAALGAAPGAAVFVGDDPELDVAGPLRVGMWTVQVGERGSDCVRPHARISHLGELSEALQSLGLLDGF